MVQHCPSYHDIDITNNTQKNDTTKKPAQHITTHQKLNNMHNHSAGGASSIRSDELPLLSEGKLLGLKARPGRTAFASLFPGREFESGANDLVHRIRGGAPPTKSLGDQSKAELQREQRIESLRASVIRPVNHAPSSRVSGTCDFFYFDESAEYWYRTSVSQRRVLPDDPCFQGAAVILIPCPNRQNVNACAKGHTAMMIRGGRRALVIIWKLDHRILWGYEATFDSNMKEFAIKPTTEFQFEWELENVFLFQFVSIYGLEGGTFIKFPARLNSIDGKLEVDCKPSRMEHIPPPKLPRPSYLSDPPPNSGPSNRKRKNRSRGKKNGVESCFRSKQVETTLCVFVPRNSTFLIPYLNQFKSTHPGSNTRSQFFLPSSNSIKMPEVPFSKRQCFIVSHDQIADIHGKQASTLPQLLGDLPTFYLLELDYYSHPIRFFIVEELEWIGLADDQRFQQFSFSTQAANFAESDMPTFNQTHEFYHGLAPPSSGDGSPSNSNNDLPGIMVSCWSLCPTITESFSIKDPGFVCDIYGAFFGSRKNTPSGGINGYVGPRHSTEPNLSPVHGPGSTYTADYQRHYYKNDHIRVHVEAKLRAAAFRVINEAAIRFNPTLVRLIGADTCSRGVLTCGSTARKIKREDGDGNILEEEKRLPKNVQALGFYNRCHLDSMDLLNDDTIVDEMFDHCFPNKEDSTSTGYLKMKQLRSQEGVGLFTTCGYNVLGNFQQPVIFFQQFFFCLPIHHSAGHHMLAWAMPHSTMVPYDIETDRIVSRNEDLSSDQRRFILGWGRTGGSAEARRAALQRAVQRGVIAAPGSLVQDLDVQD
jgi:hypothetical protein